MKTDENVFNDIDGYIAPFPAPVRKILHELRSAIKKSAPDATEKISYQMPSFYQNGILVYFAAHKNHIGFYPTATGIAAFKNELSGYNCSKGTVQFPFEKPLSLDLISRMVDFKVKENLKKAGLKKGAGKK